MSRPVLAGRGAALAAALGCCLLWGSAFPTVKAGLAYFPPTFFAGFRFTLAGLAVLLFSSRRLGAPAGWRDWRPILVIGIFQTVIGYYLYFHGMQYTSGVTGSIINSSGNLMVAAMAFYFLGERSWTPMQAAGAALGFAGVVLALMKPGWRPDFSLRGEGFMLLSAAFLSWAAILAKRIVGRTDARLISGGSMASGGLILLALAAATERVSPRAFTPASVLLLLYSALISAAAFTLWYALLRHHLVSTVTTVKFTIPLIGSLSSALFLGEELNRYKAAGGLLVGLGIYLMFARAGDGAAAPAGP